MKTILFVLLSSIMSNHVTDMIYNTPYVIQVNDTMEQLGEKGCTLSITGNGYIQGIGSVEVTLTATGRTCDEAAAELRSQIIEMQLRIK